MLRSHSPMSGVRPITVRPSSSNNLTKNLSNHLSNNQSNIQSSIQTINQSKSQSDNLQQSHPAVEHIPQLCCDQSIDQSADQSKSHSPRSTNEQSAIPPVISSLPDNAMVSKLLNNQSNNEQSINQLIVSSGHYSMQGIRAEMEDKVVTLAHPAFNELGDIDDSVNRSFFAVFDGHGGDVSAEYCRQHVHLNLLSDSAFMSDCAAALKSALVRTDVEFCAACRRIHLVSSSGTTALCAFIRNNQLSVANIGDSRGILVRKTGVQAVSDDHKPGRADERSRIEQCGGHVGVTEEEANSGRLPKCLFFSQCFPSSRPLRVFPGGLSVSRTIGDISMKTTGLIIAQPEMFEATLSEDDMFLILACDGVWDVLANSTVADLCRKNAHIQDMDELARVVAKEAFKRGSTDNISVVVVKLDWSKKL